MIKKISILLFVSTLIISCGKKGDPVFKEKNQSLEMNFSINQLDIKHSDKTKDFFQQQQIENILSIIKKGNNILMKNIGENLSQGLVI